MDASSLSVIDGLIAGLNTSGPSFQLSCLQNIRAYKAGEPIIELVDRLGQRQNDLLISNDTWYISAATCNQYCSAADIPYPFNYGQFAGAMTNYLLPWLALTAQLPYETGNPWHNVMAFCMAVGSPALITYSLTLTILNRSWARTYFGKIKEKATTEILQRRAPGFDRKISAMQFFVQESQQTPVRANNEHHWLASLIILPKNTRWWEHLEDRLKGTRRGFSPSLVAQMSLAVIAYLLTVIAAFVQSLGDPNTALQLSSGSIWIWLVPVILGWVVVGTQITDHAIADALRGHQASKARHPPLDHITTTNGNTIREDGDTYAETSDQTGIECRGGLSPQAHTGHGAHTLAGRESWGDSANLSVEGWLGFSVAGDEEVFGPTYNYARLFTWWQFTTTLGDATKTTLNNISKGRVCELSYLRSPSPPDWVDEQHTHFRSDSNAIAEYCGLNDQDKNKQYREWTAMPAMIYRTMLAGALAAIFVQWGTAGDSIMTAYMTPTIGLGCRSGSYLLYAAASTIAWLLLIIGMIFSHQAMLMYQKQLFKDSRTNFGTVIGANQAPRYQRPMKHTLVCAAAVIFRNSGKMLCIVNTLWLILTSVMELVGGFDNCWCQGVYPTKGPDGYILLFKTAKDLAQSASSWWAGGLAITVGVVIFSVAFFVMGTWKPDKD